MLHHVSGDFSARIQILRPFICADILRTRQFRCPAPKQDFSIRRFLNGQPLGGALINGMVVKSLTPEAPP
ncbi:hypothetical protein [Salmonella enterica]|uniref:hypothetical protein n=1 Tax=Salmonella enterica TaxID=28901 RepID=UPI00398C4147